MKKNESVHQTVFKQEFMTDAHQIFFFLDNVKQSVSKICRNKKKTGRIMTDRMKLDCIRTQNVGKFFDPLFFGQFLGQSSLC